MTWDYNILQQQAEINKKMMAFRMFKEHGLHYTDQIFPALHQFIVTNALRTAKEVEKELMAELAKLQAA